MKTFIIALIFIISNSATATESCEDKKEPTLKKRDVKKLALKEISNKDHLKSYVKYDIKLHESKVKDGKKDIASVTFYYKKSKPLKINFFVNCKHGNYLIEDDFLD